MPEGDLKNRKNGRRDWYSLDPNSQLPSVRNLICFINIFAMIFGIDLMSSFERAQSEANLLVV